MVNIVQSVFVVVLVACTNASQEPDWRPNIVVIMADDLGHADLGYSEGNLQTPTPNIDALANDGVILNRYYTNPICTPTRASFMTAKYTFRIGMQTGAIRQGEPWGLPTQFKIAPWYFKLANYYTAMLGKWHLGSHTRAYFPTERGFDYFFGITHGATNFFNYTFGQRYKGADQEFQSGRDLFENMKKVPPEVINNHFLPDLITEKAEQIIKNFTPGNPFYLHIATPLVRVSDELNKGVQFSMPGYQLKAAPVTNLLNDSFIKRKQQISSIIALDEQVGRIKRALDAKGISHNTIIAFMSDNGGADRSNPRQDQANHGSNAPLRMGKANLFEGGVRCNAFLWSGLLKKRGYVANRLFHVTDWLPTLLAAAGGQLFVYDGQVDGYSHWDWFLQGKDKPGPRDHLVNNIDTIGNMYAMIREEQDGTLHKMIGGNLDTNPPGFRGWVATDGTTKNKPMQKWTATSVKCKDTSQPTIHEIVPCIPQKADCLFDLTRDPCEQENLARKYPQILASLQATLRQRNISINMPSVSAPLDEKSQPALFDNWWVPWLDPNPHLESVSYEPFNPSSSY